MKVKVHEIREKEQFLLRWEKNDYGTDKVKIIDSWVEFTEFRSVYLYVKFEINLEFETKIHETHCGLIYEG